MSSSEEEIQEDPLPRHRVRFSDMDKVLQEKAIRSKSNSWVKHDKDMCWPLTCYSCAQGQLGMQIGQGVEHDDLEDDQGREGAWGWHRWMACHQRQVIRLCHHIQHQVGALLRSAWRLAQNIPSLQDAVRNEAIKLPPLSNSITLEVVTPVYVYLTRLELDQDRYCHLHASN